MYWTLWVRMYWDRRHIIFGWEKLNPEKRRWASEKTEMRLITSSGISEIVLLKNKGDKSYITIINVPADMEDTEQD